MNNVEIFLRKIFKLDLEYLESSTKPSKDLFLAIMSLLNKSKMNCSQVSGHDY